MNLTLVNNILRLELSIKNKNTHIKGGSQEYPSNIFSTVKTHFIKRKPEKYRQYTQFIIFNNVHCYTGTQTYILTF